MPRVWPVAWLKMVKGSILPSACKVSRRVISAAILSGAGMEVYQSSQSLPSLTASIRPWAWVWDNGFRLHDFPVSSVGAGQVEGVFCIGSILSACVLGGSVKDEPAARAAFRRP